MVARPRNQPSQICLSTHIPNSAPEQQEHGAVRVFREAETRQRQFARKILRVLTTCPRSLASPPGLDHRLRPLEKQYHKSESPPVRGSKRICLSNVVRRWKRSCFLPASICV